MHRAHADLIPPAIKGRGSHPIVIQGVSGSLGDQLVLKVYKGRTILCKKPTFPEDRVFSPAQLAHQQAFQEASAYGQSVKADEVYLAKADGGSKSPYNPAIADRFHKPEILALDLDGWNGAPADPVRVKARNDVQVKRVLVRFSNAAGELLEQGAATQADGLWWEYVTQGDLTGAVTVTATAIDLPGNRAEMSQEKIIAG